MSSLNAHDHAMLWPALGNHNGATYGAEQQLPSPQRNPHSKELLFFLNIKTGLIGVLEGQYTAEDCASPCLNWEEKLVLCYLSLTKTQAFTTNITGTLISIRIKCVLFDLLENRSKIDFKNKHMY